MDKRKRVLAKDQIGKVINNFKILDYKRENRRTYLFVTCPICGNNKWMRTDTITNPKVVSCGCYNASVNFKKPIDISNQRFSRLVALEPTEKRQKNGSVIWKCKCDCGRITEVGYHDLMDGSVQSCGCLQKETERKNIKKALEKRNEYRVCDTDILAIKRSMNNNFGVRYEKSRGMFVATITFQKKVYFLGRYNTYDEALTVRKEAEKKLFNNFLDWYYNKFKNNGEKNEK